MNSFELLGRNDHKVRNSGRLQKEMFMFKQRLVKMIFLSVTLSLPTSFALAADANKDTSKTTTPSKDGSKMTNTNKLASGDANFIKDAAQGGMMEVELGKLAQEKAASESVKSFGKRMEQDHSKANDELKKLAADKGVQLATALDNKHKSKVDKYAKASGADFDKRYMSEMVSDHKNDVKAFQKEADKGKDADVKQFASKTLPTLKDHLQLAESTEKEVKGSKSKSSK